MSGRTCVGHRRRVSVTEHAWGIGRRATVAERVLIGRRRTTDRYVEQSRHIDH